MLVGSLLPDNGLFFKPWIWIELQPKSSIFKSSAKQPISHSTYELNNGL